jgi:hypothetical protein
MEHPTECDIVDGSGMDAEPNDPAGILIHHDQDPVGPQGGRFAPEQIQTPETVFHVANEGQPGRATGVVSRPIMAGENPANNVFVDVDVKRQGQLVRNRGQPQVGLRCFIWTTASMTSLLGPFGPGLPLRVDEKSRRYFRFIKAW